MERAALFLPTLALAAGLAAATPAAAAQCRLCETDARPGEERLPDTQVELEIETNLDFDRLVLLDPSGGTATLRPDGTRSVSGSITDLSGRAMVGSAVVRGEPGRAVRVELPRRIDLYSLTGGHISIDQLVTDLPALPRLDSTGKLNFRFGGQLKVSGDAEGDYRGDVPIIVDYL
jgi:hypothetical protein